MPQAGESFHVPPILGFCCPAHVCHCFASAALTAVLACGLLSAAACASELTVALGSSFTTLDPYDANDTLSQNVAKSFYEGLFGFDAAMKPVPVLAAGYAVSADGR